MAVFAAVLSLKKCMIASLPQTRFGKVSRAFCLLALVLVFDDVLPVFGNAITVTNTNDSSAGSLRDAIATATSGDTINFNVPYPATITLASTLSICNSQILTISGPGTSQLAISGNNGAVQVFNKCSRANVTLSGLTIEKGSATIGGGIDNDFGIAATLKGTLLASNAGRNCTFNPLTSAGYNLSDDATCAGSFAQPTDKNNTPAKLDPKGLQNNGNPTKTVALLPTSPAVDAIPVASCTDTNGNPVKTDQRGLARPQGPGCDTGSTQVNAIISPR